MLWNRLMQGGILSRKYHVWYCFPVALEHEYLTSACGSIVTTRSHLAEAVENPPQAECCKRCLQKVSD